MRIFVHGLFHLEIVMEWFSGRLEIWYANEQGMFTPSAVYHDVSSRKAQSILDTCVSPISTALYHPAPISMTADLRGFSLEQITEFNADATHDAAFESAMAEELTDAPVPTDITDYQEAIDAGLVNKDWLVAALRRKAERDAAERSA